MRTLDNVYNDVISKIVELTSDRSKLDKYLIRPKNTADSSRPFSRNTPLSLSHLMAFMITPRAGSSQSELEIFYSSLGISAPTKSAFTMKRKLLSPDIFRDLNNDILDDYYRQPFLKQWKRHFIIAVDGTTLTMPVGARFEPLYGSASLPQDTTKRLPTARAVFLIDVLNEQISSVSIDSFGSHEPDIAIEAILGLPEYIKENSIFVFDRLYMSTWLLTILQNNNIQYVIRCRRNFSPLINQFYENSLSSEDIQLKISKAAWGAKARQHFIRHGITEEQYRPIFLHLTKSKLNDMETEVICSRINQTTISAAQAYRLYGRRWGIETAIGLEKNEWQIEIFSGYSKNAILQDIFCKIISFNLCSMATNIANDRLKRRFSHKKTTTAHDKSIPAEQPYKVNINMALISLKLLIVEIVRNRTRLNTLIKRFISEISRFYEPNGMGKSYPRKFRAYKVHGKYATFTNYKRVI